MASIGNRSNLTIPKEEVKVSGRVGHVPYSRLWVDDKKNAIPYRYTFEKYEGTAVSDWVKEAFQAQVRRWSEQTCLEFQKVELKDVVTERDLLTLCYYTKLENIRDKLILVRETGYGDSEVGISHERHICQAVEVVSKSRTWVNELCFAWSLGLLDVTAQRDFDDHMRLNMENFSNFIDKGYINNIMRCKGKAIALPIPFDYMSVTMPNSDFYGNEETLPVAVTLDPSQQYLLDYRKHGQFPGSFFDVLSVNMIYNCISKWESSCKESGKEVPKCKNFGYVAKDCSCRCSPSYSGKTCEKRTGDNIPYPTQNGAFNIELIDNKNYDLGQLLTIKTASMPGAYEDLKYNVYITVKIKPTDLKRLPTIKVVVPFKKVGELLDGKVNKFMEEIHETDCVKGMRLLWGNKKTDGRRLACECTSSLASNEPLEYARVIRGRQPNMTIILINRFGSTFKNEELTVETSKLHLITEFHSPQKLTYKQNFTSPSTPKGGSDTDNDTGNGAGNDTVPVMPSATAAAMTAAGGGGSVTAVAAAGTGVALLLLLCLFIFLLKRRKKKKPEEPEELGEDENEDDQSGSGSESDEN